MGINDQVMYAGAVVYIVCVVLYFYLHEKLIAKPNRERNRISADQMRILQHHIRTDVQLDVDFYRSVEQMTAFMARFEAEFGTETRVTNQIRSSVTKPVETHNWKEEGF